MDAGSAPRHKDVIWGVIVAFFKGTYQMGPVDVSVMRILGCIGRLSPISMSKNPNEASHVEEVRIVFSDCKPIGPLRISLFIGQNLMFVEGIEGGSGIDGGAPGMGGGGEGATV
ncbi:hypothetical protein Scep_000221 [Stephania cephalantha]|uniref:Uncharacterized protein n=1 Tax=Stephania cephalantha TaxID=152367 RepID=A0AAP0L8F3_9MAGN